MKTARQLANEMVADLLDKGLVSFTDDDARNQATDLIEKSVSSFADDVKFDAYENGRSDGFYLEEGF